MDGKTVLVTGATNGIGKAAAMELARMGAHVALVARDAARGLAVLEEIERATGNANVELYLADLSSQADVRRLAAEFSAKHQTLDVLLNNAGGVFDTRLTTKDGLEMTFALNHLAYFLLTNLLLETIKRTPGARIVNVSSSAQGIGKINFDDLQSTRYSSFGAYSMSKLANVVFTYALARRLEGTGVTANALHPGNVATGFGDNSKSAAMRFVYRVIKRFSLSPEGGADTAVYLASSPDVTGKTGGYFERRALKRSRPKSYDEGVQERLWLESARLTGLSA
jgi:NAD(P)-dependent dehydrogenase (short-subunit alcohol dehydrogenase family)